ncbi:AraC family transcriptional regulator [Massilia niastensis]|uniref:AraC family transcriptional regulator n=1 Tax=Massilia niastensis TaxID=544911 RepID=UPI0003622ACC|nr:AraC family transcriptional regulator [Massilia niastensis]
MVRSSGARGYSELMRSLGVDPLPLLARHGLPADLGQDEEAMMPLHAVAALMEESAAVTACPDFGLRLAASQDIRILGPLAVAMQHAANVREAVLTASRYLFAHSPAIQLSMVEAGSAVELRMEIVLPHTPVRRQTLDQSLGITHRIVQFIAGSSYQLLAVTLPHKPLADLRVYRRFFGAPVDAEHEHGALLLTPATLTSSLANADTALRDIALDYLGRLYGDPNLSTADRVRRALGTTLSSNRGDKAAIAGLLFLHPRTLQRRLAQEGVHFEDLRDEVRRQFALHYLSETRIPLAQLAGLLGFSDQSVLTRSCLRWFGRTPSRMRQPM